MLQTSVLLTKEMIKEMYDSTTYHRGLSYYREGRVKNLRYDQKTDTWSARVKGTYTYDLTLDIQTHSISSDCDCPAFEKYGECKHEVAVLFAILEQENKEEIKQQEMIRHQKQEYQKINQLIDAFSQHQYAELNHIDHTKKPLTVEYMLKPKPIWLSQTHVGNGLTLELKIGDKRTYVIKKIKEFLNRIKAKESIYFTPNFTYDPAEYYFSAEDQAIIETLQEMVQNEKLYYSISTSFLRAFANDDSREMIIPPMGIDSLLQKLQGRSVQFETYPTIDNKIEIMEHQQLPISFTIIKKSEKDFHLEIQGIKDGIWFEPYGYIYLKRSFYKLTSEQQKIISQLKARLIKPEQESLTIAKEQMAPFLSHVEPVLKKIGRINIHESVSDRIIAPSLEAKLYIDYDQGQLKVKAEYHYGGRIINPFQPTSIEKDDQVILMRDIAKEQEIMNIIESAPLKYNGKEMFLEEEEDLYHFLYYTLPLFEEKAEIFLTQSVRSMLLPEQQKPVISIEMNSNENWLEIGFDMDGIDQQSIRNILQSAMEKKRYYRLPNGAFISLDNEEFETVQQLFHQLEVKKTEFKNDKIIRPVYKGIQVDEIIGSGSHPSIRPGKAFRRFMQKFKNPDQQDYDIPVSIHATLRDYQKFGFQWLKTLAHYRLGGILADDMGLGKTLQSIAFIASEKEEKKMTAPILIIAPASLIYNWKNEFYKFSPDLAVRIVDGTPEERREIIKTANQADVWLTSYPLLRQDIDLYREKPFSGLILDEAQAVKNANTKTFKAVQEIRAEKRFALSGTPIENSIDELWSIFQIILPGFFANKAAFRNLSHDRMARMVRPFILRRIKKDVLKELPDKIETVQISELTKQQKEVYLAYLERIQKETRDSIQMEGFEKSRIKILAGLTRLRQICNHPALFLENYLGESGKLEQLMELINHALSSGNRLLIFSQFTGMLQMIHSRLQEEGVHSFYLDGQTPGKERVDMAEQFNRGEKEIFLISLKAGGTGLNLTGADTVILFDLWWNPAVEEQAAGRAHRIGQKKVVQVIRLITHGTIEEKIYEMQQKKKELIEKIIQPGEEMLTSLTEEDIREILSI